MARRRVTQDELAEALGITPGTLSKRLNCKQPMTVPFVERVEALLDLRVFERPLPQGPGPGVNSGCSTPDNVRPMPVRAPVRDTLLRMVA